ncbi:MAG: CHAT domain-containing protein [Chloroflexi bacterium]|nr:MAG: CHAT domain-containing protein [Chloroflexota bacterium]
MAVNAYQDFDLLITRSGADYRAFVVDAPGGDADATFALPFTANELDFLGDLAGVRRGSRPATGGAAADLKELGGLLYGAVFQGKMAAVLATSLEKAEQEQIGLRLRLRFSEETSELATLPWEILYDPVQERFLALSEASPILRYLSLPKARPTLLVKPPLRVLAVLVSPPGHDELDLAREWQVLETALSALVADGKFVLDRLERPTFAALQERLLGDDFHILHFVGHGVYDAEKGAGALVLADEESESQEISGEELATLLHNHRSLRLVYLNACEGALSSHLSVFSGVAQTLVQQGVPAAVAMQAEITDTAAIDLSRLFYAALAAGYPVDAALTQARVAIASRSAEWAIPVLFSRSPDNRLFDVVEVLPAPNCPYPGMVPFTEKQADVFFGRDKEIADGVERLRQHPFLTVIGPSGSGKSSLVYAGVIPALRKSKRFGAGEWDAKILRPGAKPLTTLAEALAASPEQLVSATFTQRTLLFVDQFEELFTLAEAAEAQLFLDCLNTLIGKPNLYILLTVRADFYPDLMASSFWQPIRANRLELTPLGDEELRAAILHPAAQVGVTIDEVLVERLVADAAGESGALPLVQETLVLLWEKVERRHLPLHAYTEMAQGNRNGLQVAIDRRATVVYNNLPDEAKPIARRVFIRLVQFGIGRMDTRQQKNEEELQAAGDDPTIFAETLRKLADSRLLTLSGGESERSRRVDISHEALIRGWSLLHGWIRQGRAAEETRRRLEQKVAEWVRIGKGEGGLLDSFELHEADEWLWRDDAAKTESSIDLNRLVALSREAIAKAEQEKESARQRELEQAQELAETERLRAEEQINSNRRLRAGSLILAVLAVVALLAGFLAWASGQNADARRMASQALGLKTSRQDTALLVAVAAVDRQLTDQTEVESSLLAAIQCCSAQVQRFVRGHEDRIWSVDVSSDGALVVSGSDDGTVIVSALESGEVITRFVDSPLGTAVYNVALSPDGEILATGNADHTVILRRTSDWMPIGEPLAAHSGAVLSVAFSPDGRFLASTGADGQVLLWELDTPKKIAQTPPPSRLLGSHAPGKWVWDLAFSGDSQTLASTGQDKSVIVWDVSTTFSKTLDIGWLGTRLTFGGDKRNMLLVAGGAGGRLWLYDMRPWQTQRDEPIQVDVDQYGSDVVWGLDISPTDEHLLVAGVDSVSNFAVVKLWRLPDLVQTEDGKLSELSLGYFGHTRGIFSVKFAPDGEQVVVGGQDGLLSLWKAGEDTHILRFDTTISAVALQEKNGKTSMLGVLGEDGRLGVVDLTIPFTVTIASLDHPGVRYALGADGTLLAYADLSGTLWLQDLANQTVERAVAEDISGAESIAIGSYPSNSNPVQTENYVAVGDTDGQVYLWQPGSDHITSVSLGERAKVASLAFHPTQKRLAIGACRSTLLAGDPSDCTSGEVQILDITTGRIANGLAAKSGYVQSLAFSSDGRWLAAGTIDSVITLWDFSSRVEQFAIPASDTDGVNALVFSKSGKLLASGYGNSKVQLWQVPSGQPYGDSFVDHDYSITGLVFSSDDRRLYSASTDHTVVIHTLDREEWQEQACRMAGRDFTPEESERYLGRLSRFLGKSVCPQ